MRRSPLRRRLPLPAGRRAAIRRTPIRQRSAKAVARALDRRVFVSTVLRARPRCEYPTCANRSTDVHERISRARGGDILDPSNAVVLCRFHHSWVHDHPNEATALGLLSHSWDRVI